MNKSQNIRPNIYPYKKQRQRTRDKKKKNEKKPPFCPREEKKTKGNPEVRKSVNKGKAFKQIGNLLFIPEIKENIVTQCRR